MASSISLKLACVVVLCLVIIAPPAQGAITCGQVISSMAPCVAYVKTNGSEGVPAPCCTGIRSLNAIAQSTPDRQAACNCIKEIITGIPGINYDLSSKLPGMCGVNIPYKITPTTDCKSVK